MAKPRPVLPAVLDRLVSARVNRPKTVGNAAVGTPGPSSTTQSSAEAPGWVRTEAVTVVPAGVWVRALLSRLAMT